MSSIRVRKSSNSLFFDLRVNGVRCREQTTLQNTPANRKRMQQVLEKIDAEITLGSFDYAKYFPNSRMLQKVAANAPKATNGAGGGGATAAPRFKDFVETWWLENEVRWREATREMIRGTLDRHLIPRFGDRTISEIGKADVLQYRAELAKLRGRNGNQVLSPKTINHYVGILKSILAEAADRHGFTDPAKRVTRLKVPRKDIEPFSIEEIRLLLANIRVDYRQYLTVRAFTGMRSGEVHGLKWKNVDFERQQILVRETSAKGRTEYTKTDGSQREIDMSPVVLAALRVQEKETKYKSEYVFCDRDGGPLDAHNVTNRVWYPLLRFLNLKKRRPYQLRHTCATLWLGAGENPEWIARQLRHTTTEMLFRVYSRYIPNLTRKDGSAFNRLVGDALIESI